MTLKELRLQHKLTQAQVAEILNVGRSCYAKYEKDMLRMPVTALYKLAQYYGLQIKDLVKDIKIQKPPIHD